VATPGAIGMSRSTLKTLAIRVGAFLSGVGVLYHEVFIASTSEPLLIFLGLWLCGIPPAMFFDGLRKLTEQAKSTMQDEIINLDLDDTKKETDA
jgi:hypothetical protein